MNEKEKVNKVLKNKHTNLYANMEPSLELALAQIEIEPQPAMPVDIEGIAAGKYAIVLYTRPCCTIENFLTKPESERPYGAASFIDLIPIEEYHAATDRAKLGELIGFDLFACLKACEKVELENGLRENGFIN